MSSGIFSIHSKPKQTNTICELCGKPKRKGEICLWLHPECFTKLRNFTITNHGVHSGMWSDEFRRQYLKEYLSKKPIKEKVIFT